MSLRRGVRCGMAAAPEAGMVTAELAVAMPSLLLAALLAVAGLQAATSQMRCLDAAAIAARLAARGEAAATVEAAATAAAPAGSRLSVDTSDGLVIARVTATVRPLAVGRLLPGFGIHEQAVSPVEPGGPEVGS